MCLIETLEANQIDQMGYLMLILEGRSPALFVLLLSGLSRLWGSSHSFLSLCSLTKWWYFEESGDI